MQQSNSPIRVLLVEDEPTQMELTRETLLDADPTLDITTVELSSNALQLLGYLEFDCIVSDYQMPEMNGIVFCRKIRETSDIPFILYTGRGSDEVAFAAFEAGVNDYVRKEKELAHYGVLARRIRHAVEKHKSDKSLREREDQIIGIFESITDGFVSLDEDWKYSYVNSAAEKGLKTFKENLIGKVLWDYWPELPEEFRDALVEAALTNTPRRAEFYYPFLDSWFQINSYPSETGVNVYFQNITERKTAELEQIKNKEKAELEKTQLQTVLETTPSAVVLLDSNGEFIYANNRALELYGFDTVGIDLETHLDKVKVLKPDGSPFPRWEIPESRSLRGLTVRNEELTIERADGRQIPVLVSSAPIYNNEGKLASAVVIFEEITDLKKMEHELGARNIELRKSLNNAKRIASEFEQIYNTAPGAMCVFDTDLRYVRVNKLMAEINGHTVGEHIGKTVWDILPDLAEMAEKIAKDIFESGEPVLNIEFNGEVASTSGVIRTWLENWHPVREGERIVGINVVAQEITDLKRAENRLIDTLDEISSSYEELAAVEEELRTSNEELRLQTLKLRESEDSLKEYADNLEHLVEERTSQLRRSEEMLRSFMDSAPDMFWLYSPDLRLLDVNKKG